MPWLVLALIPGAFLISFPLTAILVRLGHRFETFDSPGVPGQVKAPRRRVPNTGGIAIIWAIALPILLGLGLLAPLDASPVASWRTEPGLIPADLHEHIAGIHSQVPLALLLLACLFLLHIMGLLDDRRPLGPRLKLTVMVLPALAIPLVTTLAPGMSDTRLLTLLDPHVGGAWLSILVTTLWFLVVTNALNFMDNMDGLAAGVAAIAASLFLAGTLVSPQPQWFIAAVLALLIGACAGFLVFNFPRPMGARIFMGDGGSVVLGFLLAFLTTRTTYYSPDVAGPSPPHAVPSGPWYALLMPLVVLAVPLYDFTSVLLIRLSQGKPLLVGDLQHLSHRLVGLGLSRRAAVVIIWGLTAVTGISGIALASLQPWQALLVGIQTLVLLLVIALFEYARTRTP